VLVDLALALLGWACIFAVWGGFLLVIFGAVRVKEVARTPLLLIPTVAWFSFARQKLALRRSERIRAFIKRANDLRMRHKLID
jgi:hypothetical protein